MSETMPLLGSSIGSRLTNRKRKHPANTKKKGKESTTRTDNTGNKKKRRKVTGKRQKNCKKEQAPRGPVNAKKKGKESTTRTGNTGNKDQPPWQSLEEKIKEKWFVTPEIYTGFWNNYWKLKLKGQSESELVSRCELASSTFDKCSDSHRNYVQYDTLEQCKHIPKEFVAFLYKHSAFTYSDFADFWKEETTYRCWKLLSDEKNYLDKLKKKGGGQIVHYFFNEDEWAASRPNAEEKRLLKNPKYGPKSREVTVTKKKIYKRQRACFREFQSIFNDKVMKGKFFA